MMDWTRRGSTEIFSDSVGMLMFPAPVHGDGALLLLISSTIAAGPREGC